jgi:methyl acetate hydrolase
MSDSFEKSANAILPGVVAAGTGVPGVVAVATNREGNLYEGAAGVRTLGGTEPMASDSIFAIFSTTKAITGTVALKLVEDGGGQSS